MRCRIGIGYDGSRRGQDGTKRFRIQVVVMIVGDEHQRSLGLGGKIAHLAVRIGVDRLPTQAQQQACMAESMDFQFAHRGLARTFHRIRFFKFNGCPMHPSKQRYTHRGVFATPGAKINPTGGSPEGSANRIPQIRPKKASSNVKGLKLNALTDVKKIFCRERHLRGATEKNNRRDARSQRLERAGEWVSRQNSSKEKAWRKKAPRA